MNQNVWGPHTWFFLHSVTFNYPFKPTVYDKHHIKQFFKEIEDILPCSVCRRHYKEHLKKKPIKSESRKELVYWLIDLHNIVNIQEHKPTMSYQAVLDLYSREYQKKIVLEDPSDKSKKSNDEFSLYTDRKRFMNSGGNSGGNGGGNGDGECTKDNKCMEFNIWYVFLVMLVLGLLGLSIFSCACGVGNGNSTVRRGKGRGRGRRS